MLNAMTKIMDAILKIVTAMKKSKHEEYYVFRDNDTIIFQQNKVVKATIEQRSPWDFRCWVAAGEDGSVSWDKKNKKDAIDSTLETINIFKPSKNTTYNTMSADFIYNL